MVLGFFCGRFFGLFFVSLLFFFIVSCSINQYFGNCLVFLRHSWFCKKAGCFIVLQWFSAIIVFFSLSPQSGWLVDFQPGYNVCIRKLQLSVHWTFASASSTHSSQLRAIFSTARASGCSVPAFLHAEKSFTYRYNCNAALLPGNRHSAWLTLALGLHKHQNKQELRLGKSMMSVHNHLHWTLHAQSMFKAAKQELQRAGCTVTVNYYK